MNMEAADMRQKAARLFREMAGRVGVAHLLELMTAPMAEEPWPQCWIDEDPHDSYCRDCIKAAARRERRNWGAATIAGGYHGAGFESDSPQRCALCDRMLEYELTAYGLETEMEWAERKQLWDGVSREASYLRAIADAAQTHGEPPGLMRIALRWYWRVYVRQPQRLKPLLRRVMHADAFRMTCDAVDIARCQGVDANEVHDG
jgi:hypothetical protein